MFISSYARAKLPVVISLIFFLLLSFCFSGAGGFAPVEAAAGDELYLTILHTNDEHGALIPHSPTVDYHPERENPTVGGYARLASAVKEIRQKKEAAGEPVLLFSAGDYIGGSPYSWLKTEGYALEQKLKLMIGYDAVVIGNHEIDYGPDKLAAYYLEAGYPAAHDQTMILSSNIIAPSDHPLHQEGLYRESHIIVLENGLKVGLFGLIGKDAVNVTTAGEPLEFSDQHETARRMVEELKQQGAQLIIAINHTGVAEDIDLARDVSGIDVIVSGHCHTALHEPVIENGSIIVQAGYVLKYLGQLELAFNPSNGEVRIRNEENSEPFLIALDYSYPLDPDIDLVIEEYTVKLNRIIADMTHGRFMHILDTVMVSDFDLPRDPPLQESPLGNFVTDAMRLVTSEKIGLRADFAVQANGSIRGSVFPGSMPHSQGKISAYDLVSLVGLGIGPDGSPGYPIVAIYFTGEEICRLLEVANMMPLFLGNQGFLQFSGLRYDYNPDNVILFTIPFLNQPVPSTMVFPRGSVIGAERYIGDGRQGDDDDMYVPLERGDEELYCLITDSYVASFLPMVGRLLPQLEVVAKDRDGNPVAADELDKLIIYNDRQELKTWAAVLEYAASQPVGASGLPEADSYYASTAGRINPTWSIPYMTWPILILLVLIVFIVLLVRRRKLRKKNAGI